MKKKGFTLVELLAVIAILAILVIMALPAVLRMFNQARKDSFTNEVNTIIRTARQQYLLSGGTDTTWSNAEGSTKSLDLTGNSGLRYYVKMNNEGKITKLQVSNGDFQYNVTNNAGIDVASSNDVEAVTSENELVINSTGNENLMTEYVYYIDGYVVYTGMLLSDEIITYSTSQEAINNLNSPFFTRLTIETSDFDGLCIVGTNNEFNSCDERHYYYDSESTCNNGLQHFNTGTNTYTCEWQTLNNRVIDEYIGFVKDGNEYYLKGNDSSAYENNKAILVNAFGSENCTGDIAMSNTKRTLMNILGIQNVNAGTPICLTCSISNLEIEVYANGGIHATDDNQCIISDGAHCCDGVCR